MYKKKSELGTSRLSSMELSSPSNSVLVSAPFYVPCWLGWSASAVVFGSQTHVAGVPDVLEESNNGSIRRGHETEIMVIPGSVGSTGYSLTVRARHRMSTVEGYVQCWTRCVKNCII